MTLYVAQEDIYFQEILKYFDKKSVFTLDSWKFFEPLSDDLVHTFKTIAPYAVFEYLANTPKSRKNTIKFYQMNKSTIEQTIISSN